MYQHSSSHTNHDPGRYKLPLPTRTQQLFCTLYTYITYIYIHAYIHTYICTYIPTYIPTYISTSLTTYIPTYLHTYIHTYMHTCIHALYLLIFYKGEINSPGSLILCCTVHMYIEYVYTIHDTKKTYGDYSFFLLFFLITVFMYLNNNNIFLFFGAWGRV